MSRKRFGGSRRATASPSDGMARASTLEAMNVPAATRRDQLKINIERLKTLTTNLGPRYVVVNIPAARVEAIENDVAVQRHTAVVGKPDRPSPDINSKIIQINFNPFWTVPVSIVRKDLIPMMQDKPDYLTDNHIRIYDGSTGKCRRRRSTGIRKTRSTTRSGKIPATTIRSAASASISRAPYRRLYARHAAEESVRRGFPVRFLGLLPRAERARTRRLAARRNQGLGARPDRPGHQVRRTGQRQPDQAGAAALGLCHRLVGLRRRRAIPRRHLQPRRPGRPGVPATTKL